MMTATPIAAAPHRDNLLGICAALGEDFGFNPIYLRIALAVGVMFDAKAVLIAYAAAGLLVLTSRLMVRRPRRHLVVATPVPQVERIEPVDHAEPLPLAA